jgi:hypothetical protein
MATGCGNLKVTADSACLKFHVITRNCFQVHVARGKLPDNSLLGGEASHYVMLTLLPCRVSSARSKTKAGNAPKWLENIPLKGDDEATSLLIEVFAEGMLGDDLVGKVDIPFRCGACSASRINAWELIFSWVQYRGVWEQLLEHASARRGWGQDSGCN